MTIYVADFEADNLRPLATTCWCGVLKEVPTGKVWRFYDGPPILEGESEADFNLNDLGDFIGGHTLVMHNGIQYDKWLLTTTMGIDPSSYKQIDSLKISKILTPDLKVPKGMKGRVGPHSVEAYGYRQGRKKPEHEDWSKFSPEMLHRCQEDTEIQYAMYMGFLKEMRGVAYGY